MTSLFIITLDLRGVSLLSSLRSGTQSVLAPVERLATRVFSPFGDFFSEVGNLGRSKEKIDK
ncbi:MAG TPA: cell shape-determining protein, partial [Actinobacteria bacterium]|nr:cell shape-determining protein [Actinomycetota bacterium]